MSKPIIEVTGPLYVHDIMLATLAQDDPARGWKKGQEIKTSPVLVHHPEHDAYETKNTIYKVVDAQLQNPTI